MAAVVQQTQTRTRSARVTATSTSISTRLAQAPIQGHGQASAGEAAAASATSADSAVATAPASPPGGPSSISLFLANVRLLDLNLLPDWPNLTCEIFAGSGTSVQGQKRRMHCVEWVLFQLFALWDPQETANKLKPFFPPLDQLQSLNLRAALVRALEQAKKSGIFVRDTVIRKSMLDECRGDKFEEVLACFSTAVLKKVIAEDMAARGGHMFPVVDLAFENKGYRGEKTELTTLSLAHRVSLQRLLERKEEARTRYRDFSELLDVKERGIARRNEAVLAKQLNGVGHMVSDNARAEMRRTLRNNWSGNESWMEVLLRGDAKDGGLMNTPFDRVWRRVQQGRLSDIEADGAGLLQQLDSRVRVQRERLQKWDAFRRDMFGEPKTYSPSKPRTSTTEPRGIDLGFEVHRDLHLGRMSKPTATIRNQGPHMNDDYAGLVSDLKHDLARITNKDMDLVGLFSERIPMRESRRIVSTSSAEGARGEDEISDLEDAEDAFRSGVSITSFQDKLAGANRPAVRPRLSRPNLSQTSSQSSSGPRMATGQMNFPGKSQYDIDHFGPALPAPVLNRTRASVSDASIRRPRSDSRPVLPPEPVSQMQPAISPTQEVADQILESMDNASPSPVKRKPRHTLSLAERTQISLTRKKSLLLFEDEEPDLPASNPIGPMVGEPDRQMASPEPMEDLVSRTQRSMAGFEKAQQKAQMERRRSQRRAKVPPRREGAYFPKVDEDVQEAARLAEQLADEEDMEAVFRSRPKIKASPNPSPMKDWAMPE